MPPKRLPTANQTSVPKKRRIAESQRSATVYIPNSQATISSLPIALTRRDISGSQHLSTLRYEHSYYISTSTQYLLRCNDRQIHNYMSGIPRTPAGRSDRSGEEQENPSPILGPECLGKSSIYILTIFAFVNILIVNVKMMETMMMMMILLI
jgi:hypothetical protein